mgnify:CR=1 FL=1
MRSAEKTETSSSVRFLSPALSVAFWNAVPCSLSPVALTGLYSLSRDSPGLKNEKERDARIEEKKERKRIESASEKKPWRTMTTTKKKEREKKVSLSLSLSLLLPSSSPLFHLFHPRGDDQRACPPAFLSSSMTGTVESHSN